MAKARKARKDLRGEGRHGAVVPQQLCQREHQTRFLEVLRKVHPGCVRELRDTVFLPLYRATQHGGSLVVHWIALEKANRRHNPHLLRLKNAILEWAKKNNLTVRTAEGRRVEPARWVCEFVVETLDAWTCSLGMLKSKPPEWPGDYSASVFSLTARSSQTDQYTLSLVLKQPGPNPLCETWRQFTRRIARGLEPTLKEDWGQALTRCNHQYDLVPSRTKRADEHYRWFVLYQVKNWTHHQIADDYQKRKNKEVEDSAIQHAITRLTPLIGLTPRVARRGRTPKS